MNEPKQAACETHREEVAGESTDASNQPAADTQPPPSGTGDAAANRGSPAAPVMKQFAKTKAESTGRP